MLKKIRHIGIVVEDLERSIRRFESFGLPCSEIKEGKQSGPKTAFFPIGDALIEFLHYTSHDPSNVVQAQKGAINHICFEVDDLEGSIKDFENNGARLVEGCPRAGAHGRIAFFYPETTEGILIELCQV